MIKVKIIGYFQMGKRIVKKGEILEVNDEMLKKLEKIKAVVVEAKSDGIEDAIVEFQCPYCDFIGKTDASLKRHITMKHKEEISTDTKEPVEEIEEENNRPRSNE